MRKSCLILCVSFFLVLFFAGSLFAQSSSVSLSDAEGKLRRTSSDYSDNFFSFGKSGPLSVISASDENLFLRRYDSLSRVISETLWDADMENVIRETEYVYSGSKPAPDKTVEKNIRDGIRTEISFSENGLQTGSSEYSLSSGSLLHTYQWFYDKEKRMTEETVTSPGKVTEKTRFVYTGKCDSPDQFFYENNVLVKSVEFSSESEYWEKLFFTDNYEVRSHYENGIQTEEIILIDGKILRRRQW